MLLQCLIAYDLFAIKSSMIYDICRVIHKGQRRHIDSSAEIYIFLNTTIYAEVSQSQFESIRVAGRSCNQSLNLVFDQVAQVQTIFNLW